ncbi:MAG: hypothetical protein IKH75_02050 [Ruminococcus sp.]|nr:hypothetical protein [Ruminococcus sp.]
MARFDLGLAHCKLRDYSKGILTEYIHYLKEHKIDPLKEKDNQYVKNYYEVSRLGKYPTAICETEKDIKRIEKKLDDLRAFIK